MRRSAYFDAFDVNNNNDGDQNEGVNGYRNNNDKITKLELDKIVQNSYFDKIDN